MATGYIHIIYHLPSCPRIVGWEMHTRTYHPYLHYHIHINDTMSLLDIYALYAFMVASIPRSCATVRLNVAPRPGGAAKIDGQRVVPFTVLQIPPSPCKHSVFQLYPDQLGTLAIVPILSYVCAHNSSCVIRLSKFATRVVVGSE